MFFDESFVCCSENRVDRSESCLLNDQSRLVFWQTFVCLRQSCFHGDGSFILGEQDFVHSEQSFVLYRRAVGMDDGEGGFFNLTFSFDG